MNDATFNPGTKAQVIADSVSPAGYRVTTMEVTFHRFVLAEFNTHRVFSRNSASSRAIPFQKQVARVTNHPAVPVKWAAEQRGMQGGDELDEKQRDIAMAAWDSARWDAVTNAKRMHGAGVHKSIVNRLLEPFMWHTVIVTSTEWDGFWDQRCSELAQPEIKVAAEAMYEAYQASEPSLVDYDEWHLPYTDDEDWDEAIRYVENNADRHEVTNLLGDVIREYYPFDFNEAVTETVKQVSVARSARVSYLNHDGTRAIDKDLELYNRLVSADPLHASPMEHVCTPATHGEAMAGDVLGNLVGWYQMRHDVEATTNRLELV